MGDDSRFVNVKPVFKQPNDVHNVLSPPKKNHEPAKPIEEQKIGKRIKDILAQAKSLSGNAAKTTFNNQPSIKKDKLRETLTETTITTKTTFCQAHIIEDHIEFVKIVRTMKISDPGAMNLLLANGGKQYIDRGLTPAAAFDQLRKERDQASRPKKQQYQENIKSAGSVYIKGLPTIEDRWRKAKQSLVKDEDK